VTPEAPSDEAVRALAAEVLSRSEYASFRTLESESLRSFIQWLANLIDGIDALPTTNPALYVLLLVGLLALAAGLLAHVVWSVRVALAATAPLPPPRREAGAPDLVAEAQALAGAARYLEAAHTLQIACLGAVLERGAIELARHEPNRTLRERLGEARLPEPERREFLQLLGRLETRWFRDRTPEEADRELFAAWRDLHRRLRGAAVPA
jgi:hypothetical protein